MRVWSISEPQAPVQYQAEETRICSVIVYVDKKRASQQPPCSLSLRLNNLFPDTDPRFPICEMGMECMLKHRSLIFKTKDELKEKKKRKEGKEEVPEAEAPSSLQLLLFCHSKVLYY